MSSEEEIYRSSYEELRKTMESQRKAYERINRLAVDLAKIDLLTVSAVLAGVSFSGLSLSLPLVAGLVTFVYALWCCVRVYEPRISAHGLGPDAIDRIDRAVRAGADVEEHYRKLMFSYGTAISHMKTVRSSVNATFRNALWSSATAIFFFSLVWIRRLLPPYPSSLDGVVLALVSVVVLWRKKRSELE